MTNDQKAEGDASDWSLGHWSFIGHSGLVIGIFLAMLAWTWLKWPDPLIDFGRELYIPWQIIEGKVLYRDVAYFNGPLSPYFNALMFRLFGTGLRTLAGVNLVLLATLTAMIWRLVRGISDEFSATVSCVVMLTLFGFIQLVPIGNYNFVTPYSHEMTHGLILGVLALVLLGRLIDRRTEGYGAAVGVVLGLVFLTKAEMALAAGVATVVGVVLSRPSRRTLAALGIGCVVPPVVAFILLSLKMPMGTAMRGVMGSWVYAFDPALREMPFYKRVMGTAEASTNFRSALLCAMVYLGAVVPGIVLSRVLKGRAIEVAVGASVLMGIIFWWVDLNYWQGALHGMTILAPLLAGVLTLLAIRRPLPVRVMRAAFAIFAGLLLARIILDVRVMQYGFALSMPATLLGVIAGIGWLPALLRKRGFEVGAIRATLVPVVGLFVVIHLIVYGRDFSKKSTVLGNGSDSFLADPAGTRAPRGMVVSLALKHLSTLPPNATLAVLPEGVMINYLLRRPNPSGYVTLMPPEIAMFGMQPILTGLAGNAPDYVLIQRMSALGEYNLGEFETGFGEPIYRWVRTNYDPIAVPGWQNLPLQLYRKR